MGRTRKWVWAKGHFQLEKWEYKAKGSSHVTHSFDASGCGGTNRDWFDQGFLNSYVSQNAQVNASVKTAFTIAQTKARQYNAKLTALVDDAERLSAEAKSSYERMRAGLAVEEQILTSAAANYEKAASVKALVPNAVETTPALKKLFFEVEKERWEAYAACAARLAYLNLNPLMNEFTGCGIMLAGLVLAQVFILVATDEDSLALRQVEHFNYEDQLAIKENLYRLVERNWWEWFK